MNPEVIVVGSAHMDLIARAQRLPGPGESLLGSRYVALPGGKAANQAIAAARQGSRTAIIAQVGADAYGAALRDALARKGVDVAQIQVDPRLQTGICPVLMSDDGDYASIIVPGAGGALRIAALEPAWAIVQSCRVLMVQCEIDVEVSAAVARRAKTFGALVVLNAAPAPESSRAGAWTIWNDVDFLIVNRVEAGALLGIRVPGGAEATAAADALRRRYDVGSAVITLGPAGAAVSAPGLQAHIPGRRVPVVDTIGAGDAFAGAFAAALNRGDGLLDAVEPAVVAGAIAVQREGAYDACPSLDEVRSFTRHGRR